MKMRTEKTMKCGKVTKTPSSGNAGGKMEGCGGGGLGPDTPEGPRRGRPMGRATRLAGEPHLRQGPVALCSLTVSPSREAPASGLTPLHTGDLSENIPRVTRANWTTLGPRARACCPLTPARAPSGAGRGLAARGSLTSRCGK